MDGSQYDAIERRRRVIEKILLEKAYTISGKIALGAYTTDKHGERLFCSLKYIDMLADKMLGINRGG